MLLDNGNIYTENPFPDHVFTLLKKHARIDGHPIRIRNDNGGDWGAVYHYHFKEDALIEFIHAINPRILKDEIEALLRSENPVREELTVEEAIKIALTNDNAYKHVPSVSRTLLKRLIELDPNLGHLVV